MNEATCAPAPPLPHIARLAKPARRANRCGMTQASSPSLLARLLAPLHRTTPNQAETLWHAVVALARHKRWYAQLGVADTLAGRFDAITLVLCLVLLRMEADEALRKPSVRLTERFVDDMDGQLRESGVGDLVVGKHMGRLISVLGGRLGAYRDALAGQDANLLDTALARNVTLATGAGTAPLAQAVRALAAALAATPAAALLAGHLPSLDSAQGDTTP